MGLLLFELFRNPLFMGILNKWETLVWYISNAFTNFMCVSVVTMASQFLFRPTLMRNIFTQVFAHHHPLLEVHALVLAAYNGLTLMHGYEFMDIVSA